MKGRKLLADGYLELTEQQNEFLDWLTGEKPEGETMQDYSNRVGVGYSTLRSWKKDPSFLKRWENRMREKHAHPDVLSKQLSVLRTKAEGGDIKAIELYWRLVDRMTPDRVEHVESQADVSDLSDEQLDKLLNERVGAEKERRLKAVK